MQPLERYRTIWLKLLPYDTFKASLKKSLKVYQRFIYKVELYGDIWSNHTTGKFHGARDTISVTVKPGKTLAFILKDGTEIPIMLP